MYCLLFPLENKDCSKKLFWSAVDVVDNRVDIWGTVRPLLCGLQFYVVTCSSRRSTQISNIVSGTNLSE